MANVNIYDMADTWNNGATTFTAIKMDVTDTASASGSLLLDLLVGGVSQFNVTKDGDVVLAGRNLNLSSDGNATSSIWSGVSGGGGGVYIGGLGSIGTVPISVSFASLTLRQPVALQWTEGTTINSSTDLRLWRDAANTLAQRNGTNAQAFNLYNTYTDASNYERGFMKWNSNVLEVGTEAAGTGGQHQMLLKASKVLVPAGSVSSSSGVDFVFEGYTTTGLATNGSNLSFWRSGNLEFNLSNNNFRVRSGAQYAFSSSSANTAHSDTGLARDSAGVVKVTNGSTGTGELIFIVPTSDPGISGALWNNAGTLSISA